LMPKVEQEEVSTNPVNVAVPTTSIMTVLTAFKRTNYIAHDDWAGQHSIIFHVNLEHGATHVGFYSYQL
jgi:hypothetical protein